MARIVVEKISVGRAGGNIHGDTEQNSDNNDARDPRDGGH